MDKKQINIDDISTIFFLDNKKIPYVQIEENKRIDYYPVYSDEVRNIIIKRTYQKLGKTISKANQEDLLSLMVAKAMTSNEVRPIWIRTARTEDGIEIDLNNSAGECVHINSNGWSIKKATAAFYRPNSMSEMDPPVRGGKVGDFKTHFRTQSDNDLCLLIGFILASFKPEGPYPILVVNGPQGSAKSTTAEMLRSLIDPAIGGNRGLIQKEHDLFIAAKNNHLLSFDNISNIKNGVSDTLCRFSTGGSFSARKLYSGDGEVLFESCKPILLNGITDIATRADLLSRSFLVSLPVIVETERRTKEEVLRKFRKSLPELLGVIMDGLASALKNLHSVQMDKLPRMADVAVWCSAAEEGIRWYNGRFAEVLEENQIDSVINSLSTNAVAISLRSMMSNLNDDIWSGTPTDLYTLLNAHKPLYESSRAWPETPKYLSECLDRLEEQLRKIGIKYERGRTAASRTISLRKMGEFEVYHTQSSVKQRVIQFPNKEMEHLGMTQMTRMTQEISDHIFDA